MAASTLTERLAAGGIVSPRTAIAEAKRAGLRIELACALLEQESAGGQNVFGHDPSIFRGAGQVTRAKYAEYKRRRVASGNRAMQGVGPCQLTWWEFQDAADAQGGCWRPEINMRVGFRHLAGLIKRYGESDGARRYNGSGAAATAYSRELLSKARRWEAIIDGAELPAAAPRPLRQGDRGEGVERLTRRLSTLRSPVTGQRYLEAASSRLDAEVEDAVQAFQRDHGLEPDGVVGPRTMRKLRSTAKAQRARRRRAPADRPERAEPQRDRPKVPDRARKPAPARVTAMAQEVQRLENETDRAWRALVAYGHRRRGRLLGERKALEAGAGGLDAHELSQLLAALARIEGKLGTLVEVTIHRPEVPVEVTAPPVTPAPVAAVVSAAAESAATAAVTTQPGPAPPAPVNEGPAPPVTNGGAAAAAERELKEYTVPQLVREVAAFEARTRRLRDELIGRYEAVDEELVRLLGPRAQALEMPRRERRDGSGGRPVARDDGHNGRPQHRDDGGVRERPRPRPGRRPARADRPSRGERDPLGGKVVSTTLGDRGVFVRRSKIALAGYLAKKGNQEHAQLRRRLRREAATPRTGDEASPAWAKAVRAAQHIAGRPVTGELDGELTQLLLPYWPRDSAAKRVVRSTPGWRAIPGQLTPNFNVKEFACKDQARTPYIQGLMREQGLSKKEARARAKGLAERLERVRKLGGDRPLVITSAYRTKAYNASLSGSATNSSHTRGFAVDSPPPRGVSLDQHKQHVLKAFECGVGYYPQGRGYFIHGDFDRTLGGRRTW
jgi:uncharacterized protein YcbK (DUF882 family)